MPTLNAEPYAWPFDGDLAPTNTALIVIDLQRGIVARPAAPHSAADVVSRCAELAKAFRDAGALVVLVHVGFSDDDGDTSSA